MQHPTKKFNIEYSATIKSPFIDNPLKLWLAKPSDTEYQKINRFISSVKPTKTYTDKQGNKILYFNLKKNQKVKLDVNITATLTKNQATTTSLTPQKRKQYLKNEKFLEQTLQIKKLTQETIKNATTDSEKVRAVFNFIVNNFKYCYPVKKRGVKNLNLKKLRGDCGEYSSLFVTMCRVAGIPARNQTGFVIFEKQKTIQEHSWSSAYLPNQGWLPFDTQYAAIEKTKLNRSKKYFGKSPEFKIVFTKGFNIPLKPEIKKQFKTNFWKSIGLPITNSSVQILQPLVFASTHPVKFTDSIKLK